MVIAMTVVAVAWGDVLMCWSRVVTLLTFGEDQKFCISD
jgi:hypothetical protein